MNIITVIHQPRFSIFTLFDDVMLLCKGGKLAYLGPSQLALPYMQSIGFVLPLNENPADFALDVLSGSMPRTGFPAFQPEDLVPLWKDNGEAWVAAQVAIGVDSSQDAAARPAAAAVDPEQLRILEQAFDAADSDGDGTITASELKPMLVTLGVEPTAADIQAIVSELAEPSTGLLTKSNFLQYVRYGGRPPTADAAPPASASQRRVDSLYRVYSIEQYTLGNALAEMAASQLPAGLKSGPVGGPATLKDMAAASVAAGTAAPLPKRTHTVTAGTGTVPEAVPEEDESSDVSSQYNGTARTSTSGTIASVQLHADATQQHGLDGSGAESRRTSMVVKDLPPPLEEIPRGLGYRVLEFFGLEAGPSRLRATPGIFGQLVVLMSRASVKWARNWTTKFMDLLLLIAAAVACGELLERHAKRAVLVIVPKVPFAFHAAFLFFLSFCDMHTSFCRRHAWHRERSQRHPWPHRSRHAHPGHHFRHHLPLSVWPRQARVLAGRSFRRRCAPVLPVQHLRQPHRRGHPAPGVPFHLSVNDAAQHPLCNALPHRHAGGVVVLLCWVPHQRADQPAGQRACCGCGHRHDRWWVHKRREPQLQGAGHHNQTHYGAVLQSVGGGSGCYFVLQALSTLHVAFDQGFDQRGGVLWLGQVRRPFHQFFRR